MTSESVTQMMEKKVLKNVLYGTWTEDLRAECETETVFVNPFTDIQNDGFTTENRNASNHQKTTFRKSQSSSEKQLSSKSDEVPCSSVEYSQSVDQDIKGDEGKPVDDSFDKNIDEVDFFDSDEEYMEYHGHRFDEKDTDLKQQDTIKSVNGRYSEGMEQYHNLSIYKRSIQKFATDNHFEIHDVIPDGNCMFRALADQFMINGRTGYTAEKLRGIAINYLKEHPYNGENRHIQSFLCMESWEDYLSRMSRTCEWSDHIILQAVTDAFNLDIVVFNVFQDDIRRTEVNPGKDTRVQRIQMFLGHIGEFHYLSLRPDHWTSLWPYNSILYRLISCSKHLPSATRRQLIQNKIKDIGASTIVTEDEYLDLLQLQVGGESKTNTDQEKPSEGNQVHCSTIHGDYLLHFDKYCLDELQLEETEDSLNNIFFDPLHIDVMTGVPLPHLSNILKQIFPLYMINPCVWARGPLLFPTFSVHCIGSFADGNNVVLKDISKNQTKRVFYDMHRHKEIGKAVIIPRDKIVRHSDYTESSCVNIYADSSKTHPGYCQLKLPLAATGMSVINVLQKGSQKFVKGIEVEVDVSSPKDVDFKYKGLLCDAFPPSTQEWKVRERKFTFPSHHLKRKILKMNCTLIKKAHPRSKEPDIEWKYNFSMAEHVIFTGGVTESQLHGFFVFKVLVDNATFHLTKQLKNKHLKAAYLYALEEIPCEAWETNFSGCILFVLSTLIKYLKAKFLPHYFISTNNLIDCFHVEEIEALCVNVECIRAFPVTVIQNIAENHGYSYAPKLIKMVFENCKTFVHNKHLVSICMDAFIPGTLCSVKTLTRLGFYGSAFQLLQYIHEQMLLMPMSDGGFVIPSFLEIFQMVLNNIRQRSSRVILANLFDIHYQTNVLNEYIDNGKIFAKDILPWKVNYQIGWMEMPSGKMDFSSLADIFHTYSLREYDKRNSTLATLTLETAVLCVQKALEMDTISTDEIQDKALKEEIIRQRDVVMMDLKRKLKLYYIHMYDVSRLYHSTEPLQTHIDDIENLCRELPEMSYIVAEMFRYLSRNNKALEYETLGNTYLKQRKPVLRDL
ncbi:uncharacterized protein LOC125656182 isoform X1 [Ostrea edulis]|uniref:uncharacterized protein LOC125656182 isoform X1 n=2 Tax=Ostrea edulis TaxID=37623 RepID=UPI0024AECFED|nr:uncharacterized protein LOC125656182 isoform X1 [Ostrea edulis]XP_055999227.1 uncharacterized protein LOC125656182 isoform X1 [Ostrea edulis]